MGKMLSFGVRNLRSFGAAERLIPVKPINVFVGKNSCGKSTFLRTYPLLRQSVESDTRSPILWYGGYGGYVDFGDFGTALRDGQQEITFDFQMELNMVRYGDLFMNTSMKRIYAIDHHIDLFGDGELIGTHVIMVRLSVNRGEDQSLESRLESSSEGIESSLVFSGGAVKSFTFRSCETDFCESFDVELVSEKGSLIPISVARIKELKTRDSVTVRRIDEDFIRVEASQRVLALLAGAKIKAINKKIKTKIDSLAFGSLSATADSLRKAFPTHAESFDTSTKEGLDLVEGIRVNLFARNVFGFWASADDLLKEFYGGVRYLGPLRASAERFYRFQDLQVAEIDHTGSNLPMVINSLDSRSKRELSKWMQDNFGFSLELQLVGSHYALRIKEVGEERFHNISDMGFGYSQILPVIVSVWLELVDPRDRFALGISSRRLRKQKTRTLVIEQPELHLHPALQYKFGRAISKVAALGKDQGYNFVIETHSKSFIEALGESIRVGELSSDDVSIGLFEKNAHGVTEVNFSGYDEEGYLVNWPAGFLSPEL